jgi:hypothetical protein
MGATVFYFLFLLVLVPLIGIVEKYLINYVDPNTIPEVEPCYDFRSFYKYSIEYGQDNTNSNKFL